MLQLQAFLFLVSTLRPNTTKYFVLDITRFVPLLLRRLTVRQAEWCGRRHAVGAGRCTAQKRGGGGGPCYKPRFL